MRKANTYSAILDKINITTIKSLIDPKIEIVSNTKVIRYNSQLRKKDQNFRI